MSSDPDIAYLLSMPTSCPPEDASPPNGSFYRFLLCGDDPTDRENYRSHIELNKPYNDICDAHGMSLVSTLDGVRDMQRAVPFFRKKKAALINLCPSNGKVLPTPTRASIYHVTWWLAAGCSPWKMAKVI